MMITEPAPTVARLMDLLAEEHIGFTIHRRSSRQRYGVLVAIECPDDDLGSVRDAIDARTPPDDAHERGVRTRQANAARDAST
jgi:hypothetical protein